MLDTGKVYRLVELTQGWIEAYAGHLDPKASAEAVMALQNLLKTMD